MFKLLMDNSRMDLETMYFSDAFHWIKRLRMVSEQTKLCNKM